MSDISDANFKYLKIQTAEFIHYGEILYERILLYSASMIADVRWVQMNDEIMKTGTVEQ